MQNNEKIYLLILDSCVARFLIGEKTFFSLLKPMENPFSCQQELISIFKIYFIAKCQHTIINIKKQFIKLLFDNNLSKLYPH